MPTRTPQRLTSRQCKGDLLAAAVVLRQGGPIVAGTYRIAMARAGIQALTPAGIPWEVSDPKIRIFVGGQTIQCPATQGQHASICEPAPDPITISEKTAIAFLVTEVDALVDDPVGTATVTILLTSESGRPIAMSVSDSVTWAELVLEPIDSSTPSSRLAEP